MTTKITTTKRAAKKTTSKKAAGTKPNATTKAATKTTSKKPAAKISSPKAGDKKMSAINAAAKILAEAKEPLTSKQMIERMATKGYWKSPGGKTPHATLDAAIIREIQTKGKESRFQKTDRGHFALNK